MANTHRDADMRQQSVTDDAALSHPYQPYDNLNSQAQQPSRQAYVLILAYK